MDGMFDFGALFGGFGNRGEHGKRRSGSSGSGKQARKSGPPASPASQLARQLDLTYVDEDVVCVGRPWDNRTEREARRNNIGDLGRFLEERYSERFLVLNLCGSGGGSSGGESMDYLRFKYQVLEGDLERRVSLVSLFMLCHAAAYWLDTPVPGGQQQQHEEGKRRKVLVVFCGNGVYGSRLFVATFLAFRGRFASTRTALEFFYQQRLRLDQSAGSILSKQQPSLRHWLDKAQAVLDRAAHPAGGRSVPGQALNAPRPLHLFMLMMDNLPLTTTHGIIEPKFLSFLGPSEEELASAAQPVVRVYELGLNTRRVVYSTSAEEDSTVLWDAKEGKLVLKCDIVLVGDIEVECVFAGNTARPLFRYYLHTDFFESNGVFSVFGDAVDTAFRNVIDEDFKMDLVLQPVPDAKLEHYVGASKAHARRAAVQSALTSTPLDEVGLDTLTKVHFLNADPKLAKQLASALAADGSAAPDCSSSSSSSRASPVCSQLMAHFALQRTNNSMPDARRLLALGADVGDGAAGGQGAAATGRRSIGVDERAVADSSGSPVGSPAASQLGRSPRTTKTLFSSPLRHHNRRFLKTATPSPSASSGRGTPCSSAPATPVAAVLDTEGVQQQADGAQQPLAVCTTPDQNQPGRGASDLPDHDVDDEDDEDEDDANWEQLYADLEAECPMFLPTPTASSGVEASSPDAARTADSAQKVENEEEEEEEEEEDWLAGVDFGSDSEDSEPRKVSELRKPSTPDITRLLERADEQCRSPTAESLAEEMLDTESSRHASPVAQEIPGEMLRVDVDDDEEEGDELIEPQLEECVAVSATAGSAAEPSAPAPTTASATAPASASAPAPALEAKPTAADDGAVETTSRSDDSLDVFRKMLKMGVPADAVRIKMAIAGADPTAVGLSAAAAPTPAPAPLDHVAATAAPTAAAAAAAPLDDATAARFKAMLKMGVPSGAVAAKMRSEGLDPGTLGLGSPASSTSTPQSRRSGSSASAVRRKKFHWTAIPDQQLKQDSVWTVGKGSFKVRKQGRRASLGSVCSESSGPDGDQTNLGDGLISPTRLLSNEHDPDMQELEALFSQAADANNKSNKSGKSSSFSAGFGGSGGKRKTHVALLDGKRSQNVSIGLRKLRLSGAAVCAALNTFDGSTLTLERLQLMQSAQLLPTREEEKTLTSFRGDAAALGEAEAYFLALATTVQGSPETRLKAMLYRAEFDETLGQLSGRLELVADACAAVRGSEGLQKLLQVILLVGNKINNGQHQQAQHIQGFSVASLHKLSETKSFDQKTTILDFVAAFCMKRSPEVRHVNSELGILAEAKRVELSAVEAESNSLHIGYQAVLRAIKLARRAGEEQASSTEEAAKRDQGLAALHAFSGEAATELAKVGQRLAAAREAFADLLDFFCEDPKLMQAHTFFAHLDHFLASFATALRAFRAKHKKARDAKKRATGRSATAASKLAAREEDDSENAGGSNGNGNSGSSAPAWTKPEFLTPTGKVVENRAASPDSVARNKRVGAKMAMTGTPALSKFLQKP